MASLYISRVRPCLLVAGAADTSAERAGPGWRSLDRRWSANQIEEIPHG
jgi:hypothetical protein